MGWLPSVVVLLVGLVLLALVALRVLRMLRRTQGAAEALNVSVTGRSMRVRAGVGELNAWRAQRRSDGHPDDNA